MFMRVHRSPQGALPTPDVEQVFEATVLPGISSWPAVDLRCRLRLASPPTLAELVLSLVLKLDRA
jgi:hypothetical protein